MVSLGRIDRLTISGRDKNAERKLRYFYAYQGITFPGVSAVFIFKKGD